jgi:hypothetical protein
MTTVCASLEPNRAWPFDRGRHLRDERPDGDHLTSSDPDGTARWSVGSPTDPADEALPEFQPPIAAGFEEGFQVGDSGVSHLTNPSEWTIACDAGEPGCSHGRAIARPGQLRRDGPPALRLTRAAAVPASRAVRRPRIGGAPYRRERPCHIESRTRHAGFGAMSGHPAPGEAFDDGPLANRTARSVPVAHVGPVDPARDRAASRREAAATPARARVTAIARPRPHRRPRPHSTKG